MRKIIQVIVFLGSIAISSFMVSAEEKIVVNINGVNQLFDQDPIIENGNTLVPLRGIFETLGATVVWDNNSRTILATKDHLQVKLKLDSIKAEVNGVIKDISVPAKTINERTMVPLRFVSETFGADVSWDEKTNTVYISMNKQNNSNNQSHNNETTTNINTHNISNSNNLNIEQITKENDEKVVLIVTESSQFNEESQGSGFFIKENLVLTNYHVVEGASSGQIFTSNGDSFEIEGIVVFDENLDLAVLKIEGNPNISPVKIGTSTTINKGQKVIAIGSPNGYQNTVSDGIVSGIRQFEEIEYIQHTVPITYGSSGGALFDENGKVIGVTFSGMDEGNLNFAIPIDYINKWLGDDLNKDTITASFPQIQESLTQEENDLEEALGLLQSRLDTNFNKIPTSKITFNIGSWNVLQDEYEIIIYAYIDPRQRDLYLKNYPLIKDELLEWCKSLGEAIDETLPNDDIYAGVFYRDTFNYYPKSYDPEEIEQINYDEWLITHQIMEISLYDEIEWAVTE